MKAVINKNLFDLKEIKLFSQSNRISQFKIVLESHGTVYGMRIRNKINSSRHVETTVDFTCVTCQKVRLICSEGLKQCFEGFVSLQNCLIINQIYLESHFVLFLRQFARKTVDSLVESSEYDLRSRDFLQTAACIFFRQTLI